MTNLKNTNIEQQINIQRIKNDIYLISEPNRNGHNTMMTFLMGVFFSFFSIMTFTWALTDGDFLWIVTLILSSFSLFIFLQSAFLKVRKLECKIIKDKVYVRRSLFNFELYTLESKLTRTKQIEMKFIENTSSSTTGKTVKLIDIQANLNIEGVYKKVTLAEGIQGTDAAEALKNLIFTIIIANHDSLEGELEAL
jgi:hypothetical protein